MAPDPNWLYSSIAQSSAAIVAIIGGFITSTLLNRSSERESLVAHIEARQRELSTMGAQRKNARSEKNRLRASFVVDDKFNEVLGFDPVPPAAEAQKRLNASDIPLEDFTVVWHETLDVINQESALIDEQIRKYGTEEVFFDEWVKVNKIDMSNRDERVADKIYMHRQLKTSDPEDEGQHSVFGIKVPPLMPLALPIIETPQQTQWRVAKSDQRRRQLESLDGISSEIERKIALAQAELELLNERLSGFRYPSHFMLGLIVLALFAATGILLPLWLMPQDSNVFSMAHKMIAIGGFVFGLVLVFGYILLLITRLRRS